MPLNVIDLIKGQLGPALVSQAASQLGESESGVSKAIGGLLPAIVSGIANNADKPAVTDAITNVASSGLLSNLLGDSANNSVISSLLSTVFGDKLPGVLNAVSSFSGVSNSSAGSLLNLVTGATLGAVGKYTTDNNLGASGITSLLSDQKGVVSSLLPAGLSLAFLGLNPTDYNEMAQALKQDVVGDAQNVREEIEQTVINVQRDLNDDSDGGSIWKWLLPLLLLLLASWFLWKQCNKKANTAVVVVADTAKVVSDIAKVKDSFTTASSSC